MRKCIECERPICNHGSLFCGQGMCVHEFDDFTNNKIVWQFEEKKYLQDRKYRKSPTKKIKKFKSVDTEEIVLIFDEK